MVHLVRLLLLGRLLWPLFLLLQLLRLLLWLLVLLLLLLQLKLFQLLLLHLLLRRLLLQLLLPLPLPPLQLLLLPHVQLVSNTTPHRTPFRTPHPAHHFDSNHPPMGTAL